MFSALHSRPEVEDKCDSSKSKGRKKFPYFQLFQMHFLHFRWTDCSPWPLLSREKILHSNSYCPTPFSSPCPFFPIFNLPLLIRISRDFYQASFLSSLQSCPHQPCRDVCLPPPSAQLAVIQLLDLGGPKLSQFRALRPGWPVSRRDRVSPLPSQPYLLTRGTNSVRLADTDLLWLISAFSWTGQARSGKALQNGNYWWIALVAS